MLIADVVFALKMLMERYRDGQRELYCVFLELGKVYVTGAM